MNELDDEQGLRELALFAGAGGGILGGTLLGWQTVCAVERDAYAASVLAQRQNDGLLKAFPIWSDVTTFDGKPWRGIVDVISGGFPCQDISVAGKGAGITGERSGLWSEFARIISEVRPRFVFVENSPMLTVRGLGAVLGDLSSMGFNAEWGVVSAEDCGAWHERARIWIVAYPGRGKFAVCNDGSKPQRSEEAAPKGIQQPFGAGCDSKIPNTVSEPGRGRATRFQDAENARKRPSGKRGDRIRMDGWNSEPDVGRVANGVANRVDRLKAIGNGQVPIVAATAFRILTENNK